MWYKKKKKKQLQTPLKTKKNKLTHTQTHKQTEGGEKSQDAACSQNIES